jgi:hypothetical protein
MLLETIPLLDTLKHAGGKPYFESGNWAKQAWAATVPTAEETGSRPESFSSTSATYWSAASFTGNQACSMVTNRGSDIAERYWELWICFNNEHHNGYRAQFIHVAEATFTPRLFVVTEGIETSLGEGAAVTAEVGDTFGLLKEGTSIKAYYKHPSGAWTAAVSATNSTYTTGNVGWGGKGSDPQFSEFHGGSESAITGKIWPARIRLQANARASNI